eukprot:6469064-Pyramimonas_sp.AAC.1
MGQQDLGRIPKVMFQPSMHLFSTFGKGFQEPVVHASSGQAPCGLPGSTHASRNSARQGVEAFDL